VILRLVEDGKLRLNDRVASFFRWFPRGRGITIRQLLAHTSGIADVAPGLIGGIVTDPLQRVSRVKVARRTVKQTPVCLPDTCWSYSNAGYITLGLLAERVTGKPIDDLYKRYILRPLGLRHTKFLPGPGDRGLSPGYFFESPGAAPVDTAPWNFNWISTAGAMSSTAADMLKWVRALATGRGILSPHMQRMRRSFTPELTGYLPFQYGLGLLKVGTFLGHNGIVFGYEAMVLHSPKEHASIVIMGNTSPDIDDLDPTSPDPGLYKLSYKLRRILEE
jgi:D-alanyl-D-alanine carboxypeptidase